jgi:pilus assembly protein Flp/PilA
MSPAVNSFRISNCVPAMGEKGTGNYLKHSKKEQTIMIKKFFRDETGLELSEYAVAAALIALATVTAFQLLGTNITGKITSLANTVK